MKKLRLLKLNQISRAEMDEREMNSLLGGDCTQCVCGCYSGNTDSNKNANAASGYTYTKGFEGGTGYGNDACACAGSTQEEASSCVAGSSTSGGGL